MAISDTFNLQRLQMPVVRDSELKKLFASKLTYKSSPHSRPRVFGLGQLLIGHSITNLACDI